MSKDKEEELVQKIKTCGQSEAVRAFRELFTLRRERHRDRLESEESAEVRGKAKECRDLLQLFD